MSMKKVSFSVPARFMAQLRMTVISVPAGITRVPSEGHCGFRSATEWGVMP